MNVKKLNNDVLVSVRYSLGCDREDDKSNDKKIAAMEPLEMFDRYLKWNGIIGFTPTIWEAVECIKAAKSASKTRRV